VTLASYKTLGFLKYGLEIRPQYAFTAFRALLPSANYYAENIHTTALQKLIQKNFKEQYKVTLDFLRPLTEVCKGFKKKPDLFVHFR
jgi:hypothetical protein